MDLILTLYENIPSQSEVQMDHFLIFHLYSSALSSPKPNSFINVFPTTTQFINILLLWYLLKWLFFARLYKKKLYSFMQVHVTINRINMHHILTDRWKLTVVDKFLKLEMLYWYKNKEWSTWTLNIFWILNKNALRNLKSDFSKEEKHINPDKNKENIAILSTWA